MEEASLGPFLPFQLDEAVKQIEDILVVFPYLAEQGFPLDQVGLLTRYDHLLQASLAQVSLLSTVYVSS